MRLLLQGLVVTSVLSTVKQRRQICSNVPEPEVFSMNTGDSKPWENTLLTFLFAINPHGFCLWYAYLLKNNRRTYCSCFVFFLNCKHILYPKKYDIWWPFPFTVVWRVLLITSLNWTENVTCVSFLYLNKYIVLYCTNFIF